jgi:type II secretory pathway predicted ATPase ExeA
VVFLLDEAQAMPEESIEVLRLLTNLEVIVR